MAIEVEESLNADLATGATIYNKTAAADGEWEFEIQAGYSGGDDLDTAAGTLSVTVTVETANGVFTVNGGAASMAKDAGVLLAMIRVGPFFIGNGYAVTIHLKSSLGADGQVDCYTTPRLQKADVHTIKTQAVTCAAGVTIRADVGAAAAPGAANGMLIAGANLATTFVSIDCSNAFTIGDGLIITATTTVGRSGISATGNLTGHGMLLTGGTHGHGLSSLGGSTQGDGIHAEAQNVGDGMELVGAGGGYDLNADVQGNLSGSVGSVGAGGIANTAFAAGAIDAAAIAAGAIDNATFAADVGSTAYATNIIALAVNKALADYDPPTDTEMVAAFTEIKGATWAAGTDTLEHIRNKQTDIETDTGTTLDGKMDQLVAACITNAAGTDVAADIIALKAETVLIVADTNELQTDWANGGRLDLILDDAANQGNVVDSLISASPTTNSIGHYLQVIDAMVGGVTDVATTNTGKFKNRSNTTVRTVTYGSDNGSRSTSTLP